MKIPMCTNWRESFLTNLFVLPALLFCMQAARADVAAYRTGKPETRISSVPDEIRQAIFTQPKETIEPLVHWLVRDVKDDFLKVKILHDWIADNIDYDTESLLAGRREWLPWQDTLTRRKAFCQGYAELLQKMCQIAAIPCEVISGSGRGYGFMIGRAENVREPNHAWNAVKIQEHWHLIDVTWDAGHIEGKTYHKQYGTAYLFAEPRQFLHKHFPTDTKWQLLERPLTAEEFAQLPLLEGRFFEQGLKLAIALRRLHPVGDSVQFTLTVPENILLTVQLEEPGSTDKFKGRTIVRRDRKGANVLVTFPKAGCWGVRLFTKSRNDPGVYRHAGVLEFEASAGMDWKFAETFGSIGEMDSYLESPLYVPLPAGKAQEFKIRVHGAEQVQLRIGQQKWIPMERAADDAELYHVTATVPEADSVQIVARAPRASNTYWTLVDFTPERK
ncbi:MAG: transglutaminase domain-containing protein [Planctomycetota bacterium]